MAYEHTLLVQKTIPVTRECADATGIEKGTPLVYTAGGNMVIAASAAGQPCAGIAYTEKIASDGNAVVAVLCGPGDELKATASGAISKGDPVGTCTGSGFTNCLKSLSGAISLSGSVIMGIATSDAAAGNTFRYQLNIQTPAYAAS